MEWKQLASRPLCAEGAVVQGEKYRITVLTSRLFRLEYSEDGVFEDRPTQCVLNRDFPVPAYQVFETDTSLKIVTEGVELLYDKQKFSPSGLSLTVKARGCAHNGVWHYGEEVHDLGGTARTLDGADGAVELEHGLLSNWGGYSLLDDSRSLLIRPDVTDGAIKEAPGYTYVQPFRELAERVAERARRLLSDPEPAEQTSELISLPIIKNN